MKKEYNGYKALFKCCNLFFANSIELIKNYIKLLKIHLMKKWHCVIFQF